MLSCTSLLLLDEMPEWKWQRKDKPKWNRRNAFICSLWSERMMRIVSVSLNSTHSRCLCNIVCGILSDCKCYSHSFRTIPTKWINTNLVNLLFQYQFAGMSVCVCMIFIYFVFIRHIRVCVIRIPYIHSILSTFTFNRWIGVHRFGECSKIENWLHATQR